MAPSTFRLQVHGPRQITIWAVSFNVALNKIYGNGLPQGAPNHPKIIPKLFYNNPNTILKSSQNHPKILLKSSKIIPTSS